MGGTSRGVVPGVVLVLKAVGVTPHLMGSSTHKKTYIKSSRYHSKTQSSTGIPADIGKAGHPAAKSLAILQSVAMHAASLTTAAWPQGRQATEASAARKAESRTARTVRQLPTRA